MRSLDKLINLISERQEILRENARWLAFSLHDLVAFIQNLLSI